MRVTRATRRAHRLVRGRRGPPAVDPGETLTVRAHSRERPGTRLPQNGPVPIRATRPATRLPGGRAAVAALSAALVAALVGLSGCTLVEEAVREREAAASDTSPTAAAPADQDTGQDTGPTREPGEETTDDRPVTTLSVGGATIEVAAPAATVEAEDDTPGLHTVTLELAPGEVADLALTSAGALDVDSDGSVTVLDGAGTPVAALAPPAPGERTDGSTPRVTVSDVDPTHARLQVDDRVRPGEDPRAADETVRFTVAVGDHAIDRATWGENEGGRSLAVDPSDWVRHAGEAGLALVRAQLVAAEPEADSTTMDDQLVCHAVGAPDKATWNLEPWRPDVGLILTATAHCNPV